MKFSNRRRAQTIDGYLFPWKGYRVTTPYFFSDRNCRKIPTKIPGGRLAAIVLAWSRFEIRPWKGGGLDAMMGLVIEAYGIG